MLILKENLTAEARRHFGLFRNPFDGDVVDDAQMFDGADVRFARETAWQCAMTGSFVAITGESGAGKSTVKDDLRHRILKSGKEVVILQPSVLGMESKESKGRVLKTSDILHDIIVQMDANAVVPQGVPARTKVVIKMLTASAQLGNQHLLVMEEAHRLSDDGLKHMKGLHEMKHGRRPLLGILLLAQPELKVRLAEGLREGHLREVAQRCELVDLLPLDADLKPYLATRAKGVGADLAKLITDDGIEALRNRLTVRNPSNPKRAVSYCYPLAVNNWMTRLLNKAAFGGEPIVNADVVKAI